MADSFNYCGEQDYLYLFDGKIVLSSKNKKTQELYNKILSVFDTNKDGKLDGKEINSIWQQFSKADINGDYEITEDEVNQLLKDNGNFSKLKASSGELISFIKNIHKTVKNSMDKTRKNVYSRLMGEFKKKYPSEKYDISSDDKSRIIITDKKTIKGYLSA